jgi:hypothetical protein
VIEDLYIMGLIRGTRDGSDLQITKRGEELCKKIEYLFFRRVAFKNQFLDFSKTKM